VGATEHLGKVVRDEVERVVVACLEQQADDAEKSTLLAKIHIKSKPYRQLLEVIAWAKQYDPENPLDR
jgi:hypothetical protein